MTEDQAPRSLDPLALSVTLKDAGWQEVGGRRGVYERLARQVGGNRLDVLIPLDRTAPDFRQLLDFAWSRLTSSPTDSPLVESLRLRSAGGRHDALRFRKETAAPPGLIAWPVGEELIAAARATLVAGAKAHLGARRYFGNAHGRFANRYLHEVLMGQTAVGSYVVTALTPVSTPIPITSSKVEGLGIESVDIAQGRSVTESVARAVETAIEAVHHYRSTGSLAGFEDGVRRGVSYELVSALHALANDADEAGLTVEWEPSEPVPDSPQTITYELSGADAAPLDVASKRLAVFEESEPDAFIRGRVDLLTKKEAGGPGVIGLESSLPGGPRRVRVRLSPEDYHRAVQAHDMDVSVSFNGRLEREGHLYWLYDATFVAAGDPTESGTQPDLFDASQDDD